MNSGEREIDETETLKESKDPAYGRGDLWGNPELLKPEIT